MRELNEYLTCLISSYAAEGSLYISIYEWINMNVPPSGRPKSSAPAKYVAPYSNSMLALLARRQGTPGFATAFRFSSHSFPSAAALAVQPSLAEEEHTYMCIARCSALLRTTHGSGGEKWHLGGDL